MGERLKIGCVSPCVLCIFVSLRIGICCIICKYKKFYFDSNLAKKLEAIVSSFLWSTTQCRRQT